MFLSGIGNIADIKIQYFGSTKININEDSCLIARTPIGEVTENAPYSFDASGREVASRFKFHDNVVTFATDDYTRTLSMRDWWSGRGCDGDKMMCGTRESACASGSQ